ncbi:MAG TPA: CHASE3 domain-containing protein [Terriglobia bacterium]|nr:CHASE3 domain-containing protein [Terriglobia bacterium]
MNITWLGNRRTITATFALAIAILLLIVTMTYHSTLRLIQTDVSRQHNHRVLEKTGQLLSELEDAETGQRGYLITGEESYLAPYQRAVGEVRETIKELHGLVREDPNQQRDLAAIEALKEAKLTELLQTIDLRRKAGFDAAKQIVQTNVGKQAMDDMRKIIAGMDERAEKSLSVDQQIEETAARRSIQVVLLGGAVTVVLLFSTFLLLRREIAVRTSAEEKVSRLNEGLKQGSAELEAKNKEMGAFNKKLETEIGARKQAEEGVQRLNVDLEHRTEELEASNKELEAFTYSVAHDLRAPLRHIDGFSKLLLEEGGAELSEENKRYLSRICDGTNRMGQLVDDLLNLARLGRRELSLQVTGLNSVLEEVLKDVKAENANRDIRWNIQPLPFVECDPALVRQVFSNLLSNAAKYTRPRQPAAIEVSQMNEDGQPVILVRDNGVGFSMKYADKLFGVFQRLHRPEDFEGTGVGLATVHRIVRKHGGRVWAEAELDKGATFYFTLGSQKSESRNQNAEGVGKAA